MWPATAGPAPAPLDEVALPDVVVPDVVVLPDSYRSAGNASEQAVATRLATTPTARGRRCLEEEPRINRIVNARGPLLNKGVASDRLYSHSGTRGEGNEGRARTRSFRSLARAVSRQPSAASWHLPLRRRPFGYPSVVVGLQPPDPEVAVGGW